MDQWIPAQKQQFWGTAPLIDIMDSNYERKEAVAEGELGPLLEQLSYKD